MKIDAIRKHYKFLQHKNQTEIRAIKKGEIPKIVFVKTQEEFEENVVSLNSRGYDVYVGVHERKIGGTKDADVTSCKCVFVDFDCDNHHEVSKFEQFCEKNKLRYAYKIRTSPGACYHYYFPIPEITGHKDIKNSLKRAKKVFTKSGICEGIDPVVYNPSRIMRVWGTHNKKEDRDNFEVRIIEEQDITEEEQRHNYQQITDLASKIISSTNSRQRTDTAPIHCPIMHAVVNNEITKKDVEKNNVLFKNAAIYYFYRKGDTEETRKILHSIATTQKHDAREILSWFDKASKGDMSFNCLEIIKWQNRNKLELADCQACYNQQILHDNTIFRFNRGEGKSKQVQTIRDIASKYKQRGNSILSACTELSIMLTGVPGCIDTMDILIDATVQRFITEKRRNK